MAADLANDSRVKVPSCCSTRRVFAPAEPGSGRQSASALNQLITAAADLRPGTSSGRCGWTGVEAERAQNEITQSVDWSDPQQKRGTVTIAKAQEGDAPVLPKDAK